MVGRWCDRRMLRAENHEVSTWSVVIPTCNRPERLETCLGALGADLRIIVTDDSTDFRTRMLIEQKFPHVRWVQGPRRGPASNRNHGAKCSNADWLAFLDDDVAPSAGWFDALIQSASQDVDVIEGKTVCPDQSDHPLEEVVENLTGGNLWSCNFAIRSRCFEALRGFDEDFSIAGGEDLDFATRVRKAGFHTVFVQAALVFHPSRRLTWSLFWRRTWQGHWGLLASLKANFVPRRPIYAVLNLIARRLMQLLRTTWHCITRAERGRWRRPAFVQLWNWVFLPLTLPHLCYWELRFRRMIAARAMNPGADHRRRE